MVGADEEMSVTVVRWKVGEERFKKEIEKEGACAAEPQGVEKEKDIDAEIKSEVLELRKKLKKRNPRGNLKGRGRHQTSLH